MNKIPYCRHLWSNQNILQWNKNDMKSAKMTNGDYSMYYREDSNNGLSRIQVSGCQMFLIHHSVFGTFFRANPMTLFTP